ncbi:nitroreductase [archaeon SCG-AAA382B04]|nr:nitroreductase [archaeon SCG-AAA382B04]
MELSEAIEKRRSVRSYKEKEIEDEKIREIIEKGQCAPSAGNLQARDFIVVEGKEKKRRIAKAASQKFIEKAPTVIVVCANKRRSAKKYGDRGRNLYAIQDASVATQNMLLTIHAMGVSSCWIGAFDERKVKEILNLPKNVRPITILPVGYSDQNPKPPSRKNLEEVVHKEEW